MGSVNPVVILPEALKEHSESLAKTYAGSITLGSGQFCTNPGLLLGIKSESLDSFISTLSDEIVKIQPTCMIHPNIIGAYESNKANAIAQPQLSVVADYDNDVQSNYGRQAITTVEGKTFLDRKSVV